LSGSYGTRGSSVGVGVGPSPVSLGLDQPSVGIDGTVPLPIAGGLVGIRGSLDVDADATTACLGPAVGVEGANVAVQACYTAPYGYQQAVDWAADQAAPLAPLNDPATWLDPFSSFMTDY